MSDENQFTNLDFRKEFPAKNNQSSNFIKSRSKSSKILKNFCVLPKLQLRASRRPSERSLRKTEGDSNSPKNIGETDYRAYLEEAGYQQRGSRQNLLPATPLSSPAKPLQSPLDSIPEHPPKVSRKGSRMSMLSRDKQKFPIKYKILCERLGYGEEAVLKMSGSELRQIEEEHVRSKGKSYLKQSRTRSKPQSSQSQENQESTEKASHQPRHDKNYVREIFREVSEAEKFKAQVRQLQERQRQEEQRQRRKLKECEEMLGSHVYRRVVKHMQAAAKHKLTYFEELGGEGKVDDALINFLRFKIGRVRTTIDECPA